jgi:septum formation protein
MRKIILASSSPRRKALLEQIGLAFEVDGQVVEQPPEKAQDAGRLARETSLRKARSVAAHHPDAIVIAADTVGVIDGRIIGKPKSATEARAMLSALNGWSHEVITGFTVLDTRTGKAASQSVETTVFMKRLTPGEIDSYVKSGEPLDKAGAYAIQGLGAVMIERIEGDYYNVVGLPLSALADVLEEFGISVL